MKLRALLPRGYAFTVVGITVGVAGLVSLGAVGRLVRKMLRPHEIKVVAYDPFLTTDEMRRLGVRGVELAELFRISDVVSLHTPLLPETQGMVTGALIESMRPGATLINTARGAIVREAELVAAAFGTTDAASSSLRGTVAP